MLAVAGVIQMYGHRIDQTLAASIPITEVDTDTVETLIINVNKMANELSNPTSTIGVFGLISTTTANIIVASSTTGAGYWAALAVGTDGTVLTASSTATSGLSWQSTAGISEVTINSEGAATWTFASGTVANSILGIRIATSSDTLTFTPVWDVTPANGQLLIGNATDFSLGTLTGGSGISVANASGSITLWDTQAFVGTAGEILIASSTGTFTFTLPQEINTTSTVTFGTVNATDVLDIPDGANVTVDADGEVSHDTTVDQWVFGADADVLSSVKAVAVPFTSSSLPADYTLGKLPYGITVTQVDCIVDPADTGDTITIDIDERDGNGDNAATVFGNDVICDTDGTATTTFSNAALDKGDYWSVDLSGSASSTMNRGSVTIQYTITRE